VAGADTTVDLPVAGNDQVFTMRQASLLVANNKTGRGEHGQDSTRQIHILTTRTDLPAEQVIYRMGSRWRQENHFRYARMHFDLDSHDAQATTDDDPTRMVPNPAKKKAHQQLLAARARHERALAVTDAALLQAVSPQPGVTLLITNADHDRLTTDLRAAETVLDTAQHAHRAIPARLPLAQVNPGQQVLDIQTKLISHAIRIAAFNTATAMARAIRVHTGYARANHEAHALIRQALTGSGDIDPGDGTLTVRLDPLPTSRATATIAQLCEHLTATQTRYPGTNLILRYDRAGQQPGGLQRGDRQQQSRQGHLCRGGEHRVGVCQLPPPGRGPVPVAVGRRRQHRQVHCCGLRLDLFLPRGHSRRRC
jgi:hypothetical protein